MLSIGCKLGGRGLPARADISAKPLLCKEPTHYFIYCRDLLGNWKAGAYRKNSGQCYWYTRFFIRNMTIRNMRLK